MRLMQSSNIPLSLRRACRDVMATTQPLHGKVVLGLISCLPQEGVSTIAVGLTRIFSEKVSALLVDASTGFPVADLINIEHRPLKLSDLSRQHTAAIQDWVVPCPELNLQVLTLDTSEMSTPLRDDRWLPLKDLLVQRYDLIVVDLGCLQQQLSPFWNGELDHVYVVVDMARSTVGTLQRGRKELDIMRLPVAGTLLNKRSHPVPAFLQGGRS